MRKINKITNIALVFTLIGTLSLTSMAYCMETYLRNPLIKEGRLRDLEKKVTKVSLREAKKNHTQLLGELLDLITKTLSPLKDSVVTIDRLKELFEPNKEEIYQLISQIKENFIRKSLLQDNFHHYSILKRNDLPETGLCQLVSTVVDAALKKIGLSSKIAYYYLLGHCFVILSSDDGEIVIDLAFRQIIKKGTSRITIVMLDNYPEESECTLKACSMKKEKTIVALKTKEALKSKFSSARRNLLETLVSEKETITLPLASNQGAGGFVETIRLKNIITGEPLELRKVKSEEGHKYRLWENGQGLKATNLLFYDKDDVIDVANIFVGGFYKEGGYAYTSRGIGKTVLKYLKHYALGESKGIIVTNTKNYGLIRLCSKYLSSKAIYRVNGAEKYFEQVDWLEELGPITIEISDKEKLIWSGRFNKDKSSDIMGLLKEECYDDKAKDFAEKIIVINNNSRVELQWKDSYKPNTEIYFQVELDFVVSWIKISAEDLAAAQAQKIPPKILRKEI